MNYKQLSILIAVFTAFSLGLYAQPAFVQSYQAVPSNQDQIEPAAMHQCANNDLLLAWTENPGFLVSSFGVITRTDNSGNIIWSTKIDDLDSASNITIRTIGENSNGTIWVFGLIEEFSTLFYKNYFIAELSATGSLLWSEYYNVTNTYMVGNPGCHKMYDGGYMIRISFDSHVQLLRTNANGSLRWGKAYSTDSTGAKFRGRGVPTPDSGFVIIGKNGDYISYIKIDSAGNVIKSHRMLGWWNPGDGVLGGICLLPDNSVMVAGRSDFDPYLMKFDTAGNVVWIKTYTSTNINTDVIFYLHTASDGTIYAAGTRDAPINVSALGQQFHFDTSGNVIQAAANYDNTVAPGSYSISMLGNNDELFVLENGTAQGAATRLMKIGTVLGAGCQNQSITTIITQKTPLPITPVTITWTDGQPVSRDFVLSSFGLSANLLCNATAVQEPNEQPEIRVFPNPSAAGDIIRFETPVAGNWAITDAAGRVVLQGKAQEGTTLLPAQSLSSGIYIFSFTDENGKELNRQKLIKAL
jgi:hypothetical protein